MAKRQDTLRAALNPDVAAALGGGSAGASTGIVATLPPGQKEVATRAYTESLQTIWIVFVALAAFGVLCSLAIGRQKLSKVLVLQKHGLQEQERHREERKLEQRARAKSADTDAVADTDAEKALEALQQDTKVPPVL